MEEALDSLANLTLQESLCDTGDITDADIHDETFEEEHDETFEEHDETFEEEHDVWQWWEEKETAMDGALWTTLYHNGPAFPPPYEHFKFYYDGKEINLSQDAEQMAGYYAHSLDHDYASDKTKKQLFNANFFKQWQKVMTMEERESIKDFALCDFSKMHAFLKNMSLGNKPQTKKDSKRHGYCIVDGHKERVSNYIIETPGLIRETKSNKLGELKQVRPEDVKINCSPDKIPQAPPGHEWQKVIHNNGLNWLATWPTSGGRVYMKFHLNSAINGKSDYKKFEFARKLHDYINIMRDNYRRDLNSDTTMLRQLATVLYLMDRLALRVGHEAKQGDTFGACSLLTEHLHLRHDEVNNTYNVRISFTGKRKIDYHKEITVDKLVFKNLQGFQSAQNSSGNIKLFNEISATKLDKYLKKCVPTAISSNMSAKVLRTYHASLTFEEELQKITENARTQKEKLKAYKNANLLVAELLNHKKAKKVKNGKTYVTETKTSKEFYIDPRITVSWCNEHSIDINSVYTKNQLQKFKWAIGMAKNKPSFKFIANNNITI